MTHDVLFAPPAAEEIRVRSHEGIATSTSNLRSYARLQSHANSEPMGFSTTQAPDAFHTHTHFDCESQNPNLPLASLSAIPPSTRRRPSAWQSDRPVSLVVVGVAPSPPSWVHWATSSAWKAAAVCVYSSAWVGTRILVRPSIATRGAGAPLGG